MSHYDPYKAPCLFCGSPDHSIVECLEYKRKSEESDNIRKEWYNNHKCCPKCESIHVAQTLAGPIHVMGEPFEDNVNEGRCGNCNWVGPVKNMIPEKNK